MRSFAALLVASLTIAACSASSESSSGADVLDDVSAADPAATIDTTGGTGTIIEPDSTEPAVSNPPPSELLAPDPTTTEPSPPVTTPPSPTGETTVVHVGSEFGGAWTPLAIWDGSGWGEADYTDDGEIIAVPASGFDSVSVASLGLASPVTGLAYGAPDFVCVDDRQGPSLDVGVAFGDIPAVGYTGTSVAGDWDIQPRPVEQVGLDAPVYESLRELMLQDAGIDPAGGDVVQVVRADLDGNGVEEVLVTFEKTTEGFGAVGDYSMVVARYPEADGTVTDEVLFEHFPQEPTDFPTLGAGGIVAVADYNGDGIMEVVLSSTFWESSVAELFEYDGTRLVSVAESGCGL